MFESIENTGPASLGVSSHSQHDVEAYGEKVMGHSCRTLRPSTSVTLQHDIQAKGPDEDCGCLWLGKTTAFGPGQPGPLANRRDTD